MRLSLPSVAIVLASCALAAVPAARAQEVRPWIPPFADSLSAWGAEARAAFQTNSGDSVGGSNGRAYELVGRMSRRLLRSLGRANFTQAAAVEAMLDSLGLDTDVVMDPAQNAFALVMVHNPYRPGANGIGFLQWWKGNDLRLQGIRFEGGRDARMRVWWNGTTDAPYQAAIVEGRRGDPTKRVLTVLALQPNGSAWNVVQHEGTIALPPATATEFTDLNRDGKPELVVWGPTTVDSTVVGCRECPGLLGETTFTLRDGLFEVYDTRLMPSPLATFSLFVRLLGESNRVAASRLLREPSKLDEAIRLGFGAARSGSAWKVEYAEERQSWPRWLALRHLAGKGQPLYIVHFTQRDGRWVILDWAVPVKAAPPLAPPGAKGKS